MLNGLPASEIEHLRQRLRDEHAKLRGEVAAELARAEQGRYEDLAGQVHDSGEEAVADLLSELEIDALDRHVARLRLVEEALEAIRSGTYGLCRECGAQIGSARLEADPAVERCIDCQRELERGLQTPSL